MGEITHTSVIKAGDIRKARGCAKFIQMNGLHLKTKVSEKNRFYKSLLDVIKKDINVPDDEITAYALENVQTEWFELVPAAKMYAKRLADKVIRLRNYIIENYTIVGTDESFEIDLYSHFGGAVGTDSFSFEEVREKADFILKKDGELHYIKVMLSSLPYSYGARNKENMCMYSPELLAMKAGTVSKHPEAYVELWSLTSKDDKPDYLADFEAKKGKNIVSYKFDGFTVESIMKALVDSCGIVGKKLSCSDCIHKEYCSLQTAPRVGEKKDKNLFQKVTNEASAVCAAKETAAAKFTDAQRMVIEHKDGPMSVIAVPGAGKTRVLTERTKMLMKAGISHESILLISFTNKACSELKGRLESETPEAPVIMTFNSFGAFVLNKFSKNKERDLLTDGKCLSVIRDIMNEDTTPIIKGMSYDAATSDYGIINRVSNFITFIDKEGESKFRQEYADKDVEVILAIYKLYKERTAQCITFDEQISKCNEMFERHPEYAEKLAEQFQYIMVDEYQDTNESQAKLLYTIAHYHDNLVVVGDDDQAIYSWRGGNKKFLLQFPKEFPEAITVRMSDNFRSVEPVLKAAEKCLDVIEDRDEKVLIAHHTERFKPVLMRNFPLREITSLVNRAVNSGYKLGEIAILGRTNKVLAEVADCLDNASIPHYGPKQYLIEDVVFRTIFDVLTLRRDPDNDIAFYRLLKVFGVDDFEMQKVWWDLSLYQGYKNAGVMSGFDDSNLRNKRTEHVLYEALYKIANLIKVEDYFFNPMQFCMTICKKVFGISQHPALIAIGEVISEQNCECTEELFSVMTEMITFRDNKRVEYAVSDDTVNLLTAHDAKGKEFPCVFVVNFEDFGDDDESRRLMFVAMSRAKKVLFLLQSPYSNAPLGNCFEDTVTVKG